MMVALKLKGCGKFALLFPKLLFCGLILLAAIQTSPAASPINTASPIGFFTNVASRLLASELNLNLTQIEIYPTNQYTPAVQRLLQVTANIYDATTTNYYPTVFRPLFSCDQNGLGTNLYISGYEQIEAITNAPDQPFDASVLAASNAPFTNTESNVYGVPWIIGVKKGFPNFNAFTMQNLFGITRRLLVSRPNTNETFFSNPEDYTISQQLTLGITNTFWAECWNSYRADFTNAAIGILVKGVNTTILTNDEGLYYPVSFAYTNGYVTNDWPGSDWLGYGIGYTPNPASFIWQPLDMGEFVVPGWVYTFNTTPGPAFHPYSPSFFVTNTASPAQVPLMPHWGLLVTNRLQVLMYATDTGGNNHVIDYVQLIGPNGSHDVTSDIQALYDIYPGAANSNPLYDDQWDLNLNSDGIAAGIDNQLSVSLGLYFDAALYSYYWGSQSQASVIDQINGFLTFFGYDSYLPGGDSQQNQYIAVGATSIAMQASYIPTAAIAYVTDWKVNDPLVHYLASDLTDFHRCTRAILAQEITLPPFGRVTDRYKPWGGNPMYITDANPYNCALKDPLVQSSDFWNFPTGQLLNANWLGQVHRGTPWQTIYLKATDILASPGGLNTWMNLTGDPDTADAALMAPVRDWHLASLLSSLLDTNPPASLLSVNNPDTNAWQISLNGLTALTSTLPGQFVPVAISSNSPQASVIANAIQSTRAVQPGQTFRDIGDILATPQLAEQSPFLTGLNATNGISDAAYEIIPSQLLSLLRSDSIGSVAVANGQTAIQFTGSDGHVYAIEVSPNLVNWTRISTNCSVGDVINFTNLPAFNGNAQFYRSVLLK